MRAIKSTLSLAGAVFALSLMTGCAREVSTEPHIPRWVVVPEDVELQLVDWRVGETSVQGMAVGQTALDAEELRNFYVERLRARGFDVDASPVLQGGRFVQVSARSRGRDRSLNASLGGDGALVVSFSQSR